jgi:hypothetical protein
VFSVDHIFNQCGEGCIPADKFTLYKLFEPGLTKATVEHPCAATSAPKASKYAKTHNYTVYTKTVTHGIKQLNVTLDLYKPEESIEESISEDVTTPCCQNACPAGLIKVFSVDHIFNQCGEGCIPADKFNLYHLFEPGLTKATVEHPCAATSAPKASKYAPDMKYTEYTKTVTHGIKQLNVTLDLYKPAKVEALAVYAEESTPCCQNACPAGLIKVFSVDHIFNQCGEGCIPADKFNLYHLFEPGLTKATVEHPCAATKAPYNIEGHYSVYTKTVTHGVKQLNVTLDLYKPDNKPSSDDHAEKMSQLATAFSTTVRGRGTPSCIMKNCSSELGACLKDGSCRKATFCNAKCQLPWNKNVEGCNLLCELSYGYNSTTYRNMMQCMSDHSCLPTMPSDGICLADDSQTIQNLTDISQVSGKWWIVRGMNCGQKGWPAGFDYFPCQRDEFVPDPTTPGKWIDHIAYCGGTDNKCTTDMLFTVANVSMTKPGVMTHYYTDPPLKPQTEEWRVLSWPHPDWMLYVYCGDVPTGPYAGGSVVTRGHKRTTDIPAYVEKIFREVSEQYGFAYDDMCVSDDSIAACTD